MRLSLNRIAMLCVAGVFALTSAACSTPFGERLSADFSLITTASAATIDPKVVIVAASSFDALEVTGKNYLKLRRCPVNAPICRDPRATKPIIFAMQSGRKARKAALAFVKTHPGQLGPAGLYDALNTSIVTLQNIYANYNVAAVTAPR